MAAPYTNFDKLGMSESYTLYEDGSEFLGSANYSATLEALAYDEGFTADGDIDDKTWHLPGKAAKEAEKYGLPAKVRGNPLGCGCGTAQLHGISTVKDGMVEADYMCEAGWHNLMVFQVQEKKQKQEQKIQLDRNGAVTQETGYPAQELEEL